MYTKSLKQMKVGEENFKFSPVDYDKLHATRTKIKRDPNYSDYEWSIKLGGGKVVVRRNK